MKNIDLKEIYAVLSNEPRLRSLVLVAGAGEVCVCDAMTALGITQPAASKALNRLKEVGMLSDRRDANWNYFRLREDLPAPLAGLVELTVSELSGRRPYVDDARRLRKQAVRPCA
ncbi:MAG: metalloregulator ArsR/SmtB family transcription factor [Pseudomonadota bacterium]